MIVEIGHYALTLALALALVQAIVPLWGTLRGDEGLASVAQSCALGQFAAIALSFGALVYAHLASDFSVLNVAENSHSAVPTIYKISGVWGNHEGSMLLWVLILAFFGALVAGLGRGLPLILRANVLAVQGFISSAFLALHPDDVEPFRAALARRRSRGAISIRSCRISASPSIRRCSISAMSASPSSSPSPPRP